VNNAEIASEVVQIIPLLMRNIHSYMRCHNEGMATAHFRLLTILDKRSRNMSELADMQAVSLATMSNSVAILVEKGWVIRISSPDDRRIVRIEITELGRQKLAEIGEHLQSNLSNFMTELSQDEMNIVGPALVILHRLLAKDFRGHPEQMSDCNKEVQSEFK
jgi:DNA-binding MarR family transcriptional regulator